VEVVAGVLGHLPQELVAAAMVFGEQRIEVGRETLVEPGVRPFLARQQVAPPLVRQLVRQQRVAAKIDRRRGVEQIGVV
jgi:hypothetical protein